MEAPAFEIWNPNTGERWKIYANGHTEGFADPIVITNRIPRAEAEAYERGVAAGVASIVREGA